MKFLKKHKITVIAIVVFLVMVILGYNMYMLLVPNSGKAIYGDRLAGKDKVEVKPETYNAVKETISKEGFVIKVTTDERGRMVNVIVTVNNETSLESAKKLSAKLIEPFSEEQRAYFDFQILIQKEDKTQLSFPIIGYKHAGIEHFSWTKDRGNS